MPASHPMHRPIPAYEVRTQKAAIAVGAAFLLVGVLGFVPGVSTHGALFGVFTVSASQDLVHLAFAMAGFALARTFIGARRFLIGGGITYLALSVYRFVTDHGGASNVDDVSAWLHVGLAITMIALGFGLGHARQGVNPSRAT